MTPEISPLPDQPTTAEPREVEIAWAAGLFEGEGCILLTPQKRGKRRALFLASTDLDVLQRLQGIWRAGTIRPMAVRGNRKPFWRWEVQNWADVQRIGRLLLPQLCSRRHAKMELLLADEPMRGIGRCRAGHPLVGPGAEIYVRPGRSPQCAICARARAGRQRGEIARQPD